MFVFSFVSHVIQLPCAAMTRVIGVSAYAWQQSSLVGLRLDRYRVADRWAAVCELPRVQRHRAGSFRRGANVDLVFQAAAFEFCFAR